MEDDEDGLFPLVSKPAINSEYAAFATKHGVFIRTLGSGRHGLYLISEGHAISRSKPVLALSPIQPSRLAISRGDQTLIYDVRESTRSHLLPGTGRGVTAVAWSPHDSDVLATGSIDGSIHVWTLGQTWQPVHRLPHTGAPCTLIAWSPQSPTFLAVSGGSTVAIWSVATRPRLVRALSVGGKVVTSLAWHASHQSRLLTASADNSVKVWDVTEALSVVRPAQAGDDDSDDEGVFGQVEGLQKPAHPIVQIQPTTSLGAAGWIGEYGTWVLSGNGSEVRIYSYGSEFEMPQEVWWLKLEGDIESVVIRDDGGRTMLTAASPDSMNSHRIPPTVLDSVGGHAQSLASSGAIAVQVFTGSRDINSYAGIDPKDSQPRMTPITIAQLRAERGSFTKTSKQIQQRRRTDSQRSRQTAVTALADSVASPIASASRAMTSSLELPRLYGEDEESPMPFLSPTIPSRKPSPNTLPLIEDSLHLPPMQNSSFESLLSTAAHDSDSDDETFAEGMQASGTFLPGGINVPLPKACGALFAPNGQLLAFFPPRPPSQSTQNSGNRKTVETEQRVNASEVARLFPTFGNLTTGGRVFEDDSDSDTSVSSTNGPVEGPTFAMQPASFQSPFSWNNRTSPVKPTFGPTEDHPKVVVSVFDIDELLLAGRAVAEGYRTLREHDETGGDLCLHNADVAEESGHQGSAHLWQLMAMLLEDKVPMRVIGTDDDDEDVLIIARRATSMLQAGFGTDSIGRVVDDGPFAKVRWAEHPIARGWLTRQMFAWTERRADTQMLACMSAVLAEGEDTVPTRHATAQQSMRARLPTYTQQHATHTNGIHASPRKVQPMPILRTDSNPAGQVYNSPTKLHQHSQISSRNPSQPSTPHLDSTSSTPPFPFPIFSREGSRLSIPGSGSASPEHHRSSFSAAAKYYAQSITDKFASYGTSPPGKKLSASTSPSANELSSSLPLASGSWSKSVSFASAASTARDSQLSRSYVDRDDDGYDSDRTIDENSLPPTPKGVAAPVSVRLPNEQAFSDEVSGCCRMPLMPLDLAAKALVWRQYYAEQLRCWDLWMKATELEKVSGLTEQIAPTLPPFDGIVPVRAPGQRMAACSICCSVIARAEQLCPACLHTTHLACLEDYLMSLDGEAYECPTGCGCACAELPFLPTDFTISETAAVAETRRLLKKASFTDPRRWRARMEGNSW